MMAIKVQGTTVIDDSRNITNVNTISANRLIGSADTLTTARTISLSGDVSGSVSFDGSANVTLSATVADDSHNHTISNIDGLQDALDNKLSTTDLGIDLNAIAASKGVTAVDVFVYDTSLDSDGGAWRHRCQHTSWYNETLNTATRGARREFPAVAVIVLEAGKLTVYDADDPALPMWREMVGSDRLFNASLGDTWWVGRAYATSLAAMNGKIIAGQAYSVNPVNGGGAYIFDFLNDVADQRYFNYGGNTGFRANSLSEVSAGVRVQHGLPPLVSASINDVAMTVLPDAPIDPTSGLPVPTIALATAGGVSVVKDNGTVANYIDTTYPAYKVDFYDDELVFHIGGPLPIVTKKVTSALENQWNFDRMYSRLDTTANYPKLVSSNAGAAGVAKLSLKETAIGHAVSSLTLLSAGGAQDAQVKYRDLAAYLSSTYNTGWLPGDIRGAFLADTDDTDLVEATPIDDGFDYADTTSLLAAGWVLGGDAIAADVVTSGSEVVISGSDNTNNNFIYKNFTTVAGQLYKATVTSQQTGAQARTRVRDGDGQVHFTFSTNLIGSLTALIGTNTFYFIALSNLTSIAIGASNGTGTASFQDVKIEAVSDDRSPANNGLIVNGTITRSPVATGAELVAYSGFDYECTKYLSQPYNPALVFGAGDFCLMWWNMAVNTTSQNRWLLGLYDPIGGEIRLAAYMVSPGGLRLRLNNLEYAIVNNTAIPSPDAWNLFAFVRKDGVVSLYRDGNLLISQSVPAAINSAMTDEFRIGGLGSLGPNLSKFALVRIGATAPTPEQIRRIYEDEKVLFQENAACTLYGASDAVTALAHDPVADLLHVGTSAGRSVFQGLRRVAHTTTAVDKAISAVNNLIVEE